MELLRCLQYRRVRLAFPWVVIALLVGTYYSGFWSIDMLFSSRDSSPRIHKFEPRHKNILKTNPTVAKGLVQTTDVHRVKPRSRDTADMIAPPSNTMVNIPPAGHTGISTVTPAPPVKLTSPGAVAITQPSGSGVTVDQIPQVHVQHANCAKLFSRNMEERVRAERYQNKTKRQPQPDELYVKIARDCPTFIKNRQYIMQPLSQEEADFPIAFSLLIFKDLEQVERLLRAIYRPQNYYCIHVDKKSKSKFRAGVKAIAKCFENVFLSSRSVDVQWGWYSVLEPELVCMQDLWKYKKWRYFINLTGQEFPLKTNWDLVRILKSYDGANDLEGTTKMRNKERTEMIHNGFWPTDKKKSSLPVNVTLAKGSVHVAVQRGFVDFVLHNDVALKFRDWLKDTGVPDETFFSSLNLSPHLGVPGAYTGKLETDKRFKPFLTRFKNWGTWPFDWPCAGRRVRMVCVFGVGDLPRLKEQPHMFANKFYVDYQPLAYDCMEELHYNVTRDQLIGQNLLDTTYYKQLDFVRHHV